MKIGIVCYPTFGGSGAIATELGQALARREHEVHVISYAPPFRLREFRPNLQFHAVQVVSYPLFKYPPYDLALASKVMEVVEATGLDILHVHYAIPHSISAFLAREMLPGKSLKIITTLHGTDITIVGTERSYHAITRFGIEQSDGVTVVSRWLKDETERIFGVGRDMRIIPNFVDIERFRPRDDPEFRARFALPEEKLLVHASNFRPVKRVPDVVTAFAEIHRQVPSKLVLVGDGPELHGAAELTDELGIRPNVIFAGQQRSVERLLGVADLFYLPSESESFGLSALESLACGTPVVASKTGGITDVVTDGETGRLCPLGDTDCMAEFSLELLEDPNRHAAFREAARRSAVDRFAEEKIIGEYENFYMEILG